MTIPPDELYQRTREDLLIYEDARLNSLIQGVANFYLTANDQSTWGNILRAVAIELARFEYFYAYDLVNKNPAFLTPPDIRRRWADPLYVSNNWPSPTQFDNDFQTMLVDLIAAYRQGGTVQAIQDVIEAYTGKQIVVEELYKQIGTFYDQSDRNAIKVSVNIGGNNPLQDITSLNQLQQITQSLYGAIDLAKPAHVGLEFTTVFGTDDNLDCLLSPTYLTDQGYQVIPPTQQAYYTLNGYVLINPPLFWKKNTQYLVDLFLVDSNGNLQLVTAVQGDGTSGSSVPGWSFTSGAITIDHNVTYENISPPVTNISYAGGVITADAVTTLLPGQKVIFVNLGNATWLNSVLPIRKQATVLTVSPTQFTASYTDQAVISEIAIDGSNVLTVTADNDFVAGMTVTFSNMQTATFLNGQTVTVLPSGLSSTQFTANFTHALYVGTPDSGTITVTTYPSTAETQGTVAYTPAPALTVDEYDALPSQLKPLYQKQWLNSNCTGTGIQDTLTIIIEQIEQPPFQQMLIQAPVLNPINPTTTLSAWGQQLSPTLSPTGWANLPLIQFTVTNTVSDGNNATYTYTALQGGIGGTLVPPELQLHDGELVTITGCTGALNGTARIKVVAPPAPWNATVTYTQGQIVTASNGLLYIALVTSLNQPPATSPSSWSVVSSGGTFQISNTLALSDTPQSGFGNVAPTLSSAYQLSFGQYVLLQAPPLIATPNPANMPPTPTFTIPSQWVQIVDRVTSLPTGEVAGWDSTHPAGLVSPRLDAVWEISGGDELSVFGLT